MVVCCPIMGLFIKFSCSRSRHLWTCPWFHVFCKSPSCTESVTSRWTAKRLPVCAMQCETLVVDKASDVGPWALKSHESPYPTLDFRGFPGYDVIFWTIPPDKKISAFLKLSFRSCNIYHSYIMYFCFLPGCGCIFLLDFSSFKSFDCFCIWQIIK